MFHIELRILSLLRKKTKKTFRQKKNKSKRKKKVSSSSILALWCVFLYLTDNAYLQPNWDESVDRFDDMGLREEVLRGIYGYGFNKPSAIQQKGILPILQGHDTIAQVSIF